MTAAVEVGFPPPLHLVVPPAVSSSGQAAADLAAAAGLDLDPWQAWTLDQTLRRRADGKWAAGTVGVIVGRQNGKGSVLEARCLAGMFLFGERRITFTAHQFSTAKEHWERIGTLIDQTPELKRRTLSMPSGKGDEAIILRDGRRIRFLARSGRSGRGMSGDVVILDEAYEIWDEVPQALIPTMAARSVTGNPQLWYTSSPVNQEEHRHGRVLTRARNRALAGERGIAWVEWSAGDRSKLTDAELRSLRYDREAWARANPGYGVRISEEYIADTELPNLSVRGFEVERLGIGDYPSLDDDLTWDVIREAAWTARQGAAPRPEPAPRFTLAVAGSWPDAENCTVAACWADGDELVVEVVDRRAGSGWVLDRCKDIREKFDPESRGTLLGIAVAKSGTAYAALKADLAATRLPVAVFDVGDETAAAAGFKGDVDGDDPRLRHYAQSVLDDSVGGAGKHHVGDRWRWDRNGMSDPVEAVSLARWLQMIRSARRVPAIY